MEQNKEEIREEIKAKRQLINVNDELENQFADSWMVGIEKETQKPIKDLKKEYENFLNYDGSVQL